MGIDDVRSDMIFDDLSHEAFQGSMTRDKRLQRGYAILIALDGFLDTIDLPSDTPDAIEQLLLVMNDVRHD